MEGTKEHAIPQNIMSVEFKLIGDMSLRQFGYIATLLFIGFMFYVFHVDTTLTIFLTIIFLLIASFMAFVPIDGRSADTYLTNFLISIKRPTQMIWKKEKNIPDMLKVSKRIVIPSQINKDSSNLLYQSPTEFTISTADNTSAISQLDEKERLMMKNINTVINSLQPQNVSSNTNSTTSQKDTYNPFGINEMGRDAAIKDVLKSQNVNINSQNLLSGSGINDVNSPMVNNYDNPANNTDTIQVEDSSLNNNISGSTPSVNDNTDKVNKNNAQNIADNTLNQENFDKTLTSTNNLLNNISTVTNIPVNQQGIDYSNQVGSSTPSNMQDNTNTPMDNLVAEQVSSSTNMQSSSLNNDMGSDTSNQTSNVQGNINTPVDNLVAEQVSSSTNMQSSSLNNGAGDNTTTKTSDDTIVNDKLEVILEKIKVLEDENRRLKEELSSEEAEKDTHSIDEGETVVNQQDLIDHLPEFVKEANVVSGIVLTKDNKILMNAVVIIKDSTSTPIRAVKTNQLGQFYLRTPLPSGQYNVDVTYSGLSFNPVGLNLDGNKVSPLIFVPISK